MDTPPPDVKSDLPPKPPPKARKLNGVRMLRIAFAILGAPTVFSFLARVHWAFDLCTHFALQSTLLATVFLAAFLLFGQWKSAAVAGVLLLVNLARLAPFYFPNDDPQAGGPQLTLLVANVHTGNRDTTRLLQLIRRENPDVVLTMEVDRRWLRALDELKSTYPHFLEIGRSDNFGIALYSRRPAESIEEIELADSEVPTIVARLRIDGRPLAVFGTHPLPPIGGEYAGLRNRQLAALAELVSRETAPTIVAGDLNVTSWSPAFADFIRSSGLRDSRLGRGLQPSWPTSSPLIRIPIDHVLVSSDLSILDRHIGDPIGSDHFPVLVRLALPTEPR